MSHVTLGERYSCKCMACWLYKKQYRRWRTTCLNLSADPVTSMLYMRWVITWKMEAMKRVSGVCVCQGIDKVSQRTC